jgi:hypothetical protein
MTVLIDVRRQTESWGKLHLPCRIHLQREVACLQMAGNNMHVTMQCRLPHSEQAVFTETTSVVR